MIPLFKVFMSESVMDRIPKVLMSGYIGEGPITQKFETAFGEYVHNPGNVVMVNSGTSAITMALRLAGVGHGDYVISTPMTCLATNMPIHSLGAIPLWADILPDGTIDPESVLQWLRSKYKPKAVLCMDWGGQPCMLNELRELAHSHGIPLIEDACQSIGAGYNARPVGSDSDFVCWSFQAIKHLTTGDGGCLAVNGHPDLLKMARLLRWFGLDRTKSENLRCGQDPPMWGYKFHMNDIAAMIGLCNLEHICWIVRKTRAHAKKYNSRLAGLKHLKIIPFDPSRGRSGHWLYTCFAENVPHFTQYMKENGIEARKVHDRNDTKTIFSSSPPSHLPGVSYFDSHHVCIPVGWWLNPEDTDRIVEICTNYRYS